DRDLGELERLSERRDVVDGLGCPWLDGDVHAKDLAPRPRDLVEQWLPDVLRADRQLSRCPGPSQVLTGALRVEWQDDVGRVALKRGRHDPTGRDLEVRGHQWLQRGAVDGVREREAQVTVSDSLVGMAKTEERDPRQRALATIVTADVVRRPRCVHDAHEVELAALEGRGGLVCGGACDLDASDVARMPPGVRLVADEDESAVAALELTERAVDDLSFGSRPVVAVPLDRVLWERPGIRAV